MMIIKHKFVRNIPESLEDNVIYISIEFCTAVHKCICGCGNEVVTPLAPTDWSIIFNGKNISIYPSIGNWGYPCMSHYWIIDNKIIRASKWEKWEIDKGREIDLQMKRSYYKKSKK